MQTAKKIDQSAPEASVLSKALLDQYRTRKNNLLERLITAFLEEAPRFYQSVRLAAETDSFEDLRMAAHALKSCSHNLGAVRLSKICQELETAAGTRDHEQIQSLMARSGPEFFEVDQALRSELYSLKKAAPNFVQPAGFGKSNDEDWY